jgi:hypothetical protein
MAVADAVPVWSEEERSEDARRLRDEGVLVVRGRRIGRGQLAAVLEAAPAAVELIDLTKSEVRAQSLAGRKIGKLVLSGAGVSGRLEIERCEVGDLFATGATIEPTGLLSIKSTTVDHLDLRHVKTYTGLELEKATVGRFSMKHADVRGSCDFDGTKFLGDADFGQSRVKGHFDARGAVFESRADFGSAWFCDSASFTGARFEGVVSLRGCGVDGNLDLQGSRFAVTHGIGPLLVKGTVEMQGATFEHAVDIEVATVQLNLERTRFEGRANLFLRYAVVYAENVTFAEPSLIAYSTTRAVADDVLAERVRERGAYDARPRIETLRRADVGKLSLSNVNVAPCRFFGAHNVDQLRIDANSTFAVTPWPWTRRRALAEEFDWHRDHGSHHRLAHSVPAEPMGNVLLERLEADQVASIYRDLRRGQEARRDEPGAADFYYGEMEMRRRSADAPGERELLTLYWLTSGYGLRATRALAALLLTVAVFTVAFRYVGFDPDPSWTRAVLFSAESTSSLFRVPATPGVELTQVGEALQIPLRLLGPLFFALMLLSIRGRVKR